MNAGSVSLTCDYNKSKTRCFVCFLVFLSLISRTLNENCVLICDRKGAGERYIRHIPKIFLSFIEIVSQLTWSLGVFPCPQMVFTSASSCSHVNWKNEKEKKMKKKKMGKKDRSFTREITERKNDTTFKEGQKYYERHSSAHTHTHARTHSSPRLTIRVFARYPSAKYSEQNVHESCHYAKCHDAFTPRRRPYACSIKEICFSKPFLSR